MNPQAAKPNGPTNVEVWSYKLPAGNNASNIAAALKGNVPQIVSVTAEIYVPGQQLPVGSGNAADVATKLNNVIQGVTNIIPLGNTNLLFLLDKTTDPRFPSAPRDVIGLVNPENDQWVGIAFSGGGIRSATFNLGVLQGLATYKLLKRFDYLSTVSGGGYIGSWLWNWIKRAGIATVERELASAPPPVPPGDVQVLPHYGERKPINFLREYSIRSTIHRALRSGCTTDRKSDASRRERPLRDTKFWKSTAAIVVPMC